MMSGSEDDAFQSADEGENSFTKDEKDKVPAVKTEVKEEKVAAAAGKQIGSKNKKGKGKRNKGRKGRKSEETSTEEQLDLDKVSIEDTDGTAESKKDGSFCEGKAEKVTTESVDADKDVSEFIKQPEKDDAKPAATHSTKPEETQEQKQEVDAKKAFDRLTDDSQDKQSAGGWGWGGGWGGGWGSSILNTATSSVSTLTSSIGEGMKTVVETVESGLGVPDPEELARIEHERRKEREEERKKRAEVALQEMDRQEEQEKSNDKIEKNDEENTNQECTEITPKSHSSGWISGWGVSQLSNVVHKTAEVVGKVQDTGVTLVTGSLDVLETIGKKTYEVVAEGDHGVKTFRRGNGSNLSQLLREAAEEAEEKAKQEEQFVEARKSHFGAQFDDNQGLVQLEALEMLSGQCDGQVHGIVASIPDESVPQTKSLMLAIKEAFNVEDFDDEDDDQDFEGLVKDHTGELGLKITPDKLITVQANAVEWLDKEDRKSLTSDIIHQEAIQSMAKLTAAAVGYFHRVGQLCLSDQESQPSMYKNRACALAAITKVFCVEVSSLSSKYSNCLSSDAADKEETEKVNPLMTNVYLEATNSSSYIQDAFQLLFPVIQLSALQAQKREST